MIPNHSIELKGVALHNLTCHFRALGHLLNPSVGKERHPVADLHNLFQMQADIKKGKALPGVMMHDLIKLGQFLPVYNRADFIQDNQPVARHHRPQELHHHALKGRQFIHIGVRGNFHFYVPQKRRQLSLQKFSFYNVLSKPLPEHKNIVGHRHMLHQPAVRVDNANPVCRPSRAFPGVDPLAAVIHISVIERHIGLHQL